VNGTGKLVSTWKTEWQLPAVQPDQPVEWESVFPDEKLAAGAYKLLLRVAHPLPKGKPLRFANAEQDQDLPDWLTLGGFIVAPGN
jgi:hypothetical protein